jgi:hypothetical protein
MNEKNIEIIKDQLLSLGLPSDIEIDLRMNICLQQDQFQVSHRQVKEQDIMNFVFYFERKESGYCCSFYEACLRKKIFIPDSIVNEIEVWKLDEKMYKINWQILLSTKVRSADQEFEAIENVISDLKKLSVTPDGLQIANRLKIKFWMDTALAALIPNIAVLRNQYEISQRFYFFQDEEQISLDEAYRFLSHRWREKQLNVKRKQPENPVENGSAAVTKDNKLMAKRRNNKGKQHKIN